MKTRLTYILLFSLLCVSIADAASLQPKSQSVGLVLSGGGAKGIAHIGVIQALEENGIPIDYVAGTSMGAIIGGLYAIGYSPQEMLELIYSPDFDNWSTGKINKKLTYYFAKDNPTPTMMKVPIYNGSMGKSKSFLPSSIISSLPMNFAVMELFSAYSAQCNENFDDLFVPFRCVASDVTNKRKIVCSQGSLGESIRASMTFPVVFQPLEKDGVYLYDGGIYDNFPVDVMREEFSPSIMIGVDVSTPRDSVKTNDVITQLEDLIIQRNSYQLPDEEGIKLKLDLGEYNLLDFNKAQEIYKVGYDYAILMMDSIKSRVPRRVSCETLDSLRIDFKSKTPHLTFSNVNVSGGNKFQNEYVKQLFYNNKTETISINDARDAYYRAITAGTLKDLYPTAIYNDSTKTFDLNLKMKVRDDVVVGVGGYITSSTNRYIFLSGGYKPMKYNSFNSKINVWLGQSYMAGELESRLMLRPKHQSSIDIQGVLSRQKLYESNNLFYEDNMPTFVTETEAFARLKYGMAISKNGKTDIALGIGHLKNQFFENNDASESYRVNLRYNLAQLALNAEYNTLDNNQYPTNGTFYKALAMGVVGNNKYSSMVAGDGEVDDDVRWVQASIVAKRYYSFNRHFSLGLELDAFASNKKLLSNYNATIINATSFNPTASSYDAFNSAFRANSYLAGGIIPIWKINENLQTRGVFHCFLPYKKIYKNNIDFTPYYGRCFSNPEFFGEVALVYNFPFASLSLYGNYMSNREWGCGVSFGVFILAPKFLK